MHNPNFNISCPAAKSNSQAFNNSKSKCAAVCLVCLLTESVIRWDESKKHRSLSGQDGHAHGFPEIDTRVFHSDCLSVTYKSDSSDLLYACISSSAPCGHTWGFKVP